MMLSKVLGATGRLLIVAGVVILGFVAYQLWGTSIEESRQQDDLLSEYATSIGADPDAELTDVVAPSDEEPAGETSAPQGPAPTPSPGEPVGIIEIPRIDLTRMVVEGTSRADLKKGPGHYIGTPFPGQNGNVGIAGHRTTYGAPFNRIDELQPGDEIVLSTSQGSFTYEVIAAPGSTNQAWYTVSPSQVEVLEDMGDNRVTLTACHPKYSAKQRIIVHAVLKAEPVPPSPIDATDVASAQASVAQDFDEGLGSTPEELPISLAYGGVAALVALGAWLVARNVKQWWAVWLVAAPILVVLIWNGYVHMDRYLPAI
jgi:sortase A